MQIRLEKIDPEKRQQRFYVMHVAQTLFGEWCLIREWGRIGTRGGQRLVDYVTTKAEAETALKKLMGQKCRRGYLRPMTVATPIVAAPKRRVHAQREFRTSGMGSEPPNALAARSTQQPHDS